MNIMRKQIAAANWKMNLSQNEADSLLDQLVASELNLSENQSAIFAVPAIYIPLAIQKLAGKQQMFVAAQNCHQKANGAYTGEIAASMYASVGVNHIVLGHSERREFFAESDSLLAEKTEAVLAIGSTPIFCCGEPLSIREAGTQNSFVEAQLKNALFQVLLRMDVLPWDEDVARCYGALCSQLEAKGINLSDFDMMIAAHAQSVKATLVSRDKAFGQIAEGLTLEVW